MKLHSFKKRMSQVTQKTGRAFDLLHFKKNKGKELGWNVWD